MTPQEFIAAILPGALASQAADKIPAGFTIAQCALETGWLHSVPPGNNLFGIKADSAWAGPTVDVVTHEVRNGVRVQETDAFRSYPSYVASIVDHGDFLRANPRYADCFKTTDSVAFSEAVAGYGYATDPLYCDKLTQIIRAHDLTQYDLAPT